MMSYQGGTQLWVVWNSIIKGFPMDGALVNPSCHILFMTIRTHNNFAIVIFILPHVVIFGVSL